MSAFYINGYQRRYIFCNLFSSCLRFCENSEVGLFLIQICKPKSSITKSMPFTFSLESSVSNQALDGEVMELATLCYLLSG